MKERFARGIVDRRPTRAGGTMPESGIDGYVDYGFADTGVYFTYRCCARGTEHHEAHEYVGLTSVHRR